MLTIYKDRLIHIEWTIYKGTSSVREDFTRALVKCFLIGPREKYLVNATAQNGTLYMELPQGLEEGTYSIETIYVKNQGNLTPRRENLSPGNAPDYRRTPYPTFKPHDARYNDRCIMRSRRDCLFAITEYEQEEEGVPTASSGEVTLRFKTSTSSYGYDGLSAYEIAVMRGDFNGSEKEFIEASLKLGIATSERLGGIKAEEKTDNETEEAKIDPVTGKLYVPAGKANVEIATSEKVGGIKAEQKTSRETVEAKIDPKTGKLYVEPIGEGSVTYNFTNFPDDEDLTEETRENEEKVMKLADKEYNAAMFSGLGRVYLRKNISSSKNVLTQEVINNQKTRYIVQYDYDLNASIINIPDDCVLDFQGGSFKNGVLSFSKPCTINADRQIFNGVTLQSDSVFCDTDINPAWFGVKGDGITDDTEAIKYMLSFCKNIKNKVHEVRNGADYSPRIVFKKRAYYKITSPICIDFKCHIIGDPVFLYTGEEIDENPDNFSETGAAIIITNQYNTTFEFSIVRMDASYIDSTSINVDLSSGKQFAALKTKLCVWCNFKIHQIFGFHTGIYMLCKGTNSTWQCTFDVHYISFTLHAAIINTIEEGFSNGNKWYNTVFVGPTGSAGGMTVPSNFSNGNFLKFIGDGTYGANSWVIDNIQIETKILNKYPIYFVEINLDNVDSSKPFRDFSIKNLRLENIGSTISSGTLWKSNAPHQNINIETNLYTSVATMELDYYGVKTSINNPVLKSAGIIYKDSMLYGIEFDYKAMVSMLYYCGRYYNLDNKVRLVSRQIDTSNSDSISLFACPSYIINIAPGQMFRFQKQQTQRAYFVFYDSEGTKIDIPDDIKYDNLLYKVILSGYKNHLSTSNDTDTSVYIINTSNSVTYRFAIVYLDSYRLDSNKAVVTNTISKLKIKGTEADRPSLTSTSDGYEYYNTDANEKQILIGGKWTSMSGTVSSSISHSFNYEYAKRCLKYLNRYYNIDDKYKLVGISTSVPNNIDLLTIYSTVGEVIKLSPSQKISFSKKEGKRLYIVFYDSNGTKIDFPSSDIAYSDSTLYISILEGYKNYLQALNDNIVSGYIQNNSETEYRISIILLDDYVLTSNKTIEVITNENKLLFSGNNDNRPSLDADNKGYQYYNTDLNKPTWWNGNTWIDGSGAEIV